jgi:hypothetical protein
MLESVLLAAADDKFAAWMVLSGVIVGGLITFCTQCGLELLRAQIQGCQLAGALAGELKGFKEIMFVWQVKEDLKGDLKSMTNNKKAAVLRTFEADESFLIQVFLKNTEKIGILQRKRFRWRYRLWLFRGALLHFGFTFGTVTISHYPYLVTCGHPTGKHSNQTT